MEPKDIQFDHGANHNAESAEVLALHEIIRAKLDDGVRELIQSDLYGIRGAHAARKLVIGMSETYGTVLNLASELVAAIQRYADHHPSAQDLQDISETFFQSDDSPISLLNSQDMLRLGDAMMENPNVLPGARLHHVLSEIVERFYHNNTAVIRARIEEGIAGSAQATETDTAQWLRMVDLISRSAEYVGSMGYASSAVEDIRMVIKEIGQADQRPLVRLVVEQMMVERPQAAYFLTGQDWSTVLQTDPPLHYGRQLRPLAQGVLGVFHHNGELRDIIHVPDDVSPTQQESRSQERSRVLRRANAEDKARAIAKYHGISYEQALMQELTSAERAQEQAKRLVSTIPLKELVAGSRWQPYSDTEAESMVQLVEIIMQRQMLNTLSEQLGVQLQDMQLGSLVQLMRFLVRADTAQYERVISVVQRFPDTEVLSSFLALGDAGVADQYLQWLETADAEQVHEITSHYGSVVRNISELDTVIAEYAPAGTVESFNTAAIAASYVEKANALLLTAITATGEVADTTKDLAQVDQAAAMFANLCKFALQEGTIQSPEQLQHVQLDTIIGSDVIKDSELVNEMLEMSRVNWVDDPAVYHDLVDVLTHSDKADQRNRTRFFILHDARTEPTKLLSFLRIEQQPNDSLYVGSFNSHADMQSVGLAHPLVRTALEVSTQEDKPLVAEVRTYNPVAAYYIGRLGFEATSFQTVGDAMDVGDLHIERTPTTATLSKAEVIAQNKQLQQDWETDYQPHIDSASIEAFQSSIARYVAGREHIVVQLPDNPTMVNQIYDTMLNKHTYRLTEMSCLDPGCEQRLARFVA